jgi:hypothetical protein
MRQYSGFLFILFSIILGISKSSAQSLEIMSGSEAVFADAQWLHFFDDERKWSLFSRSRAQVDYDNQSSLFMGAYANYSIKWGLGLSLVGRISSTGSGGDGGIHYFLATERSVLFLLFSSAIDDVLSFSSFGIYRYRHPISEHWKVYLALELFSNIDPDGHNFSVQRSRLGMDHKSWQFGLAYNSSQIGSDFIQLDDNPRLFIRKEF